VRRMIAESKFNQTLSKYKLLTIAIPTYNRNEILYRNLEELILQMSDWVELLIVDNASDIPVEYSLKKLISGNINRNIRIVRNKENIGGNANVLRCIEEANSDYIWILGDDDYPLADALEKIYLEIKNREAIWVSFYSPDDCQPSRSKNFHLKTLSDFLSNLESISELVFCSINIYSLKYIRHGLEFGYTYQDKMAPHLISMISGIEKYGEKGSYVISKEVLLNSIANNQDYSTSWPLYKAYIGIMSIYKIPFTHPNSMQLNRLIRGARSRWLSNKDMLLGFSNLNLRYGAIDSFKISSDFFISLIAIDRYKFLWTFPIYIIGIIFGKKILPLYKLFKYYYIKYNSKQ